MAGAARSGAPGFSEPSRPGIPDFLRPAGGIEVKLTLLRHGYTGGEPATALLRQHRPSVTAGRVGSLSCFAGTGRLPHCRAVLYQRYAADGANAFGSVRSGSPYGVTRAAGNGFWHFEMRTYEELKQDAAYQRWICGNIEEHVCPNGESGVK